MLQFQRKNLLSVYLINKTEKTYYKTAKFYNSKECYETSKFAILNHDSFQHQKKN